MNAAAKVAARTVLRTLAARVWQSGACRLCGQPCHQAAQRVRGLQLDKPVLLPGQFAALAAMLCPSCLVLWGQPPTLSTQAPRLVAGTPPLLAWLGPYEAAARALVHDFKYRGHKELAAPLGDLLALRLAAPWSRPRLLVPLPLHRSRHAQRGYNQSELLARRLSAALGWPVANVIARHRATAPQSGLSRHGRLQNLAGAFTAVRPCHGCRLVLVDDVCTTGATLAAAAAACYRAGAAHVAAATLFLAADSPSATSQRAATTKAGGVSSGVEFVSPTRRQRS